MQTHGSGHHACLEAARFVRDGPNLRHLQVLGGLHVTQATMSCQQAGFLTLQG
jgi:hypothetical protein